MLIAIGPPKRSKQTRLEQQEAREAMYDDRRSKEAD
jgi:hypothetical protein